MVGQSTYKQKLDVLEQQQELIEDESEQEAKEAKARQEAKEAEEAEMQRLKQEQEAAAKRDEFVPDEKVIVNPIVIMMVIIFLTG